MPIAVNVIVSLTCIPFIDLQSCTLYNALVPCFIIDDFVAKTNCGYASQDISNIYSVVSSVKTINSGKTWKTDVLHALETQ
jgi:hypothetical protein